MFVRALAHLEARGRRGRLVDLGGGVGHFAERALVRGWDAYSQDISEAARSAAAARLGADRSLSPQQASEFAGTCDAVTMWCVVAHTLDPLGLVRHALELLRPGGLLLITTPNFVFQATLARLLARLHRPYDLVSHDHVLHFDPRSAAVLLHEAGVDQFTFEYLGVTEHCILSERHSSLLVPLKRIWNWAGSRITTLGLPPVCAELQIVGVKPG